MTIYVKIVIQNYTENLKMNCEDCRISEKSAQLWKYKGKILCVRCLKQHLQADGIIHLINEPKQTIPSISLVKEDSSLL